MVFTTFNQRSKGEKIMKLDGLMTNLKAVTARTSFAFDKRKPEIYLAVGIASGIAGTVMACKATLKVDAVIVEHKENIAKIRQVQNDPELSKQYSDEDAKKDVVTQYAHTAVGVIKLYGPAIMLGSIAIASVCASHNVLSKRNTALAAAYATVDTAFKKYRNNVVEKYGEKVDQELRYGTRAQEIVETVVDEKGKEKTKTKTIDIVQPGDPSEYARYFTKGNPDFNEKDETLNELFFRSQQNYLNDILRINGHLTLNEAYKALNMKESKAGMVVGWIYNKNNTSGDNYVQIIRKPVYIPNETDGTSDFGYLVDFNVDGNIYNRM